MMSKQLEFVFLLFESYNRKESLFAGCWRNCCNHFGRDIHSKRADRHT